MKRLVILVALALILAGLLLSEISDTSASIADTTIPDDEVTSKEGNVDNSDSPSASITITMYALPEEEWR